MTYTGHTVTKSAELAVPFEDARKQLRLDDMSQDDDYIRMVVAALCDAVERDYTILLLTGTVIETHTKFPAMSTEPLFVMVRPGVSVTSVAYIDSTGATQTFSSGSYDVKTGSAGMYIVPKVNSEWPTDLAVRPDAVTITYTAGYGAGPSSVPGAIRLAILNKLGKMDSDREDSVSEKRTASDVLLQSFYQFKA